MDFLTLEALRLHHPSWKLLRSEHAPLIVSFLHDVFVLPNVRVMSAADLVERLDDALYARRLSDAGAFPKAALEYLNDWAGADKGWLRKYYKPGSDEAQFDLTPASERAVAWLSQLTARQFVGTESRLLTLFELLQQMSQGSESDPAKRVADLQQKRAELDREIARIQGGDVPLLDDSALKDRFQQFTQGARELLADFREVEHNFRQLDRRVRERIALWDGSKGTLLEQIMGERDAIGDSDQGRSFRAFWDFLLSSDRQQTLSDMLQRVLSLPAIASLQPDVRTGRVHYDWMEAGEHTQRTVAGLSQQLRHFLDDQAWLENRRIMDILHRIEAHAIALTNAMPSGSFSQLSDASAAVELAMERPLFTPALKPLIQSLELQSGVADSDIRALFDQVAVDTARLKREVQRALQQSRQVTLAQVVDAAPLQQGLAELIAYLQLANTVFAASVDEQTLEHIHWQANAEDGAVVQRSAHLPRVIFLRELA